MTIFNKQELASKFALVKNAIAKNSTINHLKMLNINVTGNKFKLTGGNGEMQVTVSGECIGDDVFNECVMPNTFNVMIGATKNDINMIVKDGILSTISGKSKFNIPSIDGEMYPLIKLDGDINQFNLRELIGSVYRASASKDLRVMLTGTCIQVTGNTINAVATDGHVLMINQHEINMDDFQIIIPNGASEYLGNNDTDGFVVSGSSLKAVSTHNNLEVITKLVDAKYVSWERVVVDYSNKFTVNRSELIDAVSTINKIENAAHVNLKSSGESLIISTKDGNGTSVVSEIDFTGDEVNVSFNPSKLLSCLQSIDCDEIEISFNNESYIQSKDGSHKFFLSPMRI